MKTFFYSAQAAKCEVGCRFATCSKRCLSILTGLPALRNMKVLPGGSELKTPRSMELRSGDILILYAGNQGEIEQLIGMKDSLERLRIILIVAEDCIKDITNHHALNPRFTTSLGQNMSELNTIIYRLESRPRLMDHHSPQKEGEYHA